MFDVINCYEWQWRTVRAEPGLPVGLTVEHVFLYSCKVRVRPGEPTSPFLWLASPTAPAPAFRSQFPIASVPAGFLSFFLFFFPGMFQFMVNYFYFLVTLTL